MEVAGATSGREDYARAGRLTGLIYGGIQLAYLFPALVVTILAHEVGTSEDAVQLVLGLSGASGVVVTGYWLFRRVHLPPAWRLAISVASLGLALIAFGIWPRISTLALALLLGAALGPSSMLVRHTVARQFGGREGSFLAISQTWTYLTRVIGSIAFTLAVFGVLELRWATAVLGGAVLAIAAVYLGWGRIPKRGVEVDLRDDGRPDAEPIPLGRLASSPPLWKGLVATTGIYTAFQVYWAELQPRITASGLSDHAAAVVVAVISCTVLLSIPWVRKHARLSDSDATRSAGDASRILCLAAGFGLLSLVPGLEGLALAIGVLIGYTVLIEIGGNATSSAITAALSKLDARAVLMSALARSLAGAIGGVITALVAWTGAVWSIVVLAGLTMLALRKWELHPTLGGQGWIEGASNPLTIRTTVLEPRGEADADDDPAEFSVSFEAPGGTVGPWPVWDRDTIDAKIPLEPCVRRSQRIWVFRVRFDPGSVTRRASRRTSGWIYVGASMPVVLNGVRRGTLRWRMFALGRWTIEDDNLTLRTAALNPPTQFVHYRHGLAGSARPPIGT